MRISSFSYLMKQGIKGIWKNRMLSFASFCILMVSLILVGMSALTSLNINHMINIIADKNEVMAVVKDGTSKEDIEAIKTSIEDLGNVKSITFYSKDDAWKGFMDNYTEEEKQLFSYSDTNPLPDTYKVQIADISKMKSTTREIASIANIDSVTSPTEFSDMLVSIRKIFYIVACVLIIALIVVSMVIISNTTRASVYARRKEINIMKYVGATNAFIKIPFFVEGMIVGLLASLGSFVVTKYIYDAFFNLFEKSPVIMNVLGKSGIIPFDTLSTKTILAYLAAGIVVGAFGTMFSTRKHLKV